MGFFKTRSHASESTVFDTVYWNQPISLAVLYGTALFFFLHSGPRILISGSPDCGEFMVSKRWSRVLASVLRTPLARHSLGQCASFICLVNLVCPVPTWNLFLLFTYKFCWKCEFFEFCPFSVTWGRSKVGLSVGVHINSQLVTTNAASEAMLENLCSQSRKLGVRNCWPKFHGLSLCYWLA